MSVMGQLLHAWPEAALTPQHLRYGSEIAPDVAALDSAASVRALTDAQARSLTGAHIDALTNKGLMDSLGNRWLMKQQECEYNPPSRSWVPDARAHAVANDGRLDVAILMVDDRSPLPYHIPGTPFQSPDAWGLPRTTLSRDYLPPRWGPMSVELANAEAVAAMEAAASYRTGTPSKSGRAANSYRDPPSPGDGVDNNGDESRSSDTSQDGDGNDSDDSGDSGNSSSSKSDDSSPESRATRRGEAIHAQGSIDNGKTGSQRQRRISSFQLAVTINHIFAQLQNYAFYLEAPCVNATIGVSESMWSESISSALKRSRRGKYTTKHRRYLKSERVCARLSAAHKLGPFPPRPAAWAKLAAIRYVARRHAFVLYLDSDAFCSRIWQPVEPLISLLGLRTAEKWLAVAGEYPPQKLRRDTRAGLANSGVLLLAGLPTAGPGVLRLLEDWIWPSRGVPLATFTWPFEQNALTQNVILGFKYSRRVALLKPGCPLNSPFGAYIRHYVGGTPDRSVYHPNYRPAWLLAALRCTVGLVADAATSATRVGDSSRVGSPHIEVVQRAEGCAANEPELLLRLDAFCGQSSNFSSAESGIMRGHRPVDGDVVARVSASWWRACCALCVHHEPCAAWGFHDDWPAHTRNCMLLNGFTAVQRVSSARTMLGRIPGRGGTAAAAMRSVAHVADEDERMVAYAVPPVGPWDEEA